MSYLSPLQNALQTYHEQIEQLTLSGCPVFAETSLLALLRQRDRIQTLLEASASESNPDTIPPQSLIALSEDDATVGKWNDALFGSSAPCLAKEP